MIHEKTKYAAAEELRVSWSSAILFIFFVFFLFNFWELLHERFFVEWEKDTFGRLFVADYNVDALFFGLAGLLLLTVVVCVMFRKQVWRFITSMQLGIVLMFAVSIGTILGTLVFQNSPEGDYEAYYGSALTFLIQRLNLDNVFEAWWFLAFEVLLAVSLLTVTIRTRPWSLGRMGAATIHLGIVAIIIGAFVGTAFHTEAVLFVGEDQELDFAVKEEFINRLADYPEIVSRIQQQPVFGDPRYDVLAPQHIDMIPQDMRVPLGGSIYLEEFEELYYEEPYAVMLGKQVQRQNIRTNQVETVTRSVTQVEFDEDKPVVLGDDMGKLKIEEVYRNFKRVKKLVPAENGEALARIHIEDTSHGHGADEEVDHSHERTMVIDDSTMARPLRGTTSTIMQDMSDLDRFTNPNNAFYLRYTWSRPTDEQIAELGLLEPQAPYVIMSRRMQQSEGGMSHDNMRLNIGESGTLSGTDYTVRLLDYYHAFNVKLNPDGTSTYENNSELLRNPTIIVEVTGGELEEPMTLALSSAGMAPNDPVMRRFIQETNMLIGFALSPQQNLILVGETGEMMVYAEGELQETVNVTETPYNPAFTGLYITLEEAIESGKVEVEFSNDNPENNYAVSLSITRKDGETRSTTLELLDSSVNRDLLQQEHERYFMRLGDSHFVSFQVRGDYIKDWRSHVNVREDGEVVADHRIRVNEPLVYNGFYFYQSDWQPKVPFGVEPDRWFTYLRVTKDPGLPLVFLGIAMLVFGMIWVFYIGPRFRKTAPASAEE